MRWNGLEIAAGLALWGAQAHAGEGHCTATETVLASCTLNDSTGRVASLCHGPSFVYRFGVPGTPEWIFEGKGAAPRDSFRYAPAYHIRATETWMVRNGDTDYVFRPALRGPGGVLDVEVAGQSEAQRPCKEMLFAVPKRLDHLYGAPEDACAPGEHVALVARLEGRPFEVCGRGQSVAVHGLRPDVVMFGVSRQHAVFESAAERLEIHHLVQRGTSTWYLDYSTTEATLGLQDAPDAQTWEGELEVLYQDLRGLVHPTPPAGHLCQADERLAAHVDGASICAGPTPATVTMRLDGGGVCRGALHRPDQYVLEGNAWLRWDETGISAAAGAQLLPRSLAGQRLTGPIPGVDLVPAAARSTNLQQFDNFVPAPLVVGEDGVSWSIGDTRGTFLGDPGDRERPLQPAPPMPSLACLGAPSRSSMRFDATSAYAKLSVDWTWEGDTWLDLRALE